MTATDDLRSMFDSRYLGNWDLNGQDVTVTIERVEGGVVEGEKGRKDRAPLVYLKGWPKPWVMNKTNLKTIASLYGSTKASVLRGKRVTLYATTCQGKGGGTVDCIRVRPTIPTTPGVPQPGTGGGA
jgi:hypothetical protein